MDQAPDREDRVQFAWLARLLGKVMAAYITLVAHTIRVSGPPINQGQVIFAVWHETNLAAATAAWKLRNDKHPLVFSTRGFRGIVMNSMLRAFRSPIVTLPDEGAGTRREAAALTRTMARLARAGSSLVISCDGPFGPYRVAKPGVVIVARECGLPIQPWAIATRPPWRLKGRWDRMIVPLPFGRMRIYEGEPIVLGERDRLKPRLAELQAELDRVQALADHRVD
jgi:3-deoxy-D-manno-octulosonic-acid transferase